MVKAALGPRGEQSAVVHSLKNSIVRELEPKDYLSEILAVRFFAAERIRYSNDALAVEQVQDPERISDQIIQHGKAVGDCFPEGTLVLSGTGGLVPIESLVPGVFIQGLHIMSRVEAVVSKGVLPLDALTLNNGAVVRLTADHHVFVLLCSKHGRNKCKCPVASRQKERLRVADVHAGMVLTTPPVLPLDYDRNEIGPGARKIEKDGPLGLRVVARDPMHDLLRVDSIKRDVSTAPCWDIQTDDHHVYLPEHDVTVSQCDDIATWTAAVCRQLGREASFVTVGFGPAGHYTHVFVRVKEPKSGRWIVCDPVAGPNEASMLRRVTTYKIWEM